jgi:dihydropteroate synthase
LDKSSLTLATTRCRDTEFRWEERTYVMGILNLSPDSFSKDGLGSDINAIVTRAKCLVDEGADIIDIGGESTRPDSQPIPISEELRRVIPALEKVAGEVSVPISIDTYKSEVASQALRAGASMINDVWGLKRDQRLAQVAARAGVPIVLMSNQRDSDTSCDIMVAIIASLKESIKLAIAAGVAEQNIIVDPGIGFGKSAKQNLEIIRRLAELRVLGKPILLGTSRKFSTNKSPDERLQATSATVAIGIAHGADVVRVHDVWQIVQVCRMSDAIIRKEVR